MKPSNKSDVAMLEDAFDLLISYNEAISQIVDYNISKADASYWLIGLTQRYILSQAFCILSVIRLIAVRTNSNFILTLVRSHWDPEQDTCKKKKTHYP